MGTMIYGLVILIVNLAIVVASGQPIGGWTILALICGAMLFGYGLHELYVKKGLIK